MISTTSASRRDGVWKVRKNRAMARSASCGARVGWSKRSRQRWRRDGAIHVQPDDAGAVAVLAGEVEVAAPLIARPVDAIHDETRFAAFEGFLIEQEVGFLALLVLGDAGVSRQVFAAPGGLARPLGTCEQNDLFHRGLRLAVSRSRFPPILYHETQPREPDQ